MPITDPVIAIDEAGAMTDPDDPYLVVVGLLSNRGNRQVERILKRERQRIRASRKKQGGRHTGELKFRNSTDQSRRRILNDLREGEVEIIVFSVEKAGLSISDTPENYGEFVWGVLEESLVRYPGAAILVDSHFNLVERREAFNRFVAGKAGHRLTIEHRDSQFNPFLGLADFVAGALLRELRQGESRYADIVREKIVHWERMKWKKHKR